jgi:hypothetical protein
LVDPLVNEIVELLKKWKSLRMCSGMIVNILSVCDFFSMQGAIFRSSTNVEDIAEFNGAGIF